MTAEIFAEYSWLGILNVHSRMYEPKRLGEKLVEEQGVNEWLCVALCVAPSAL